MILFQYINYFTEGEYRFHKLREDHPNYGDLQTLQYRYDRAKFFKVKI